MVLNEPTKKLIVFGGICVVVFGNAWAAEASAESAEKPQRIVSVNLCTDELLFRLVPPEQMAALTKHSENPDVSTIAGQAKGIKRVQGNIEDVAACQPDLVLGGRFSNRETLRFFENSNIPVLVFSVPKTFEDIYADIRELAKEVGETERGERMIKEMREQLAQLSPPTNRKKKAVFFQSGGYVPGADTFENAIMEAAGLENAAVGLGIKEYGSLSLEKLIEIKPDVLIFTSDQKNGKTVRGEILTHPVIRKALSGIKTVTLPSSFLNCGSPASVEAVRILVKEVSS